MKKFSALKFAASILTVFAMLCSFLPQISFAAEAAATSAAAAATVTVEGVVKSKCSGVEVAIDVFREGKSFADIVEGVSMKEVLLYHGQTTSGEGGAYSFTFDAYGSGNCMAYVCADGEVTSRTLYYEPIELEASLTSNQTGHIYYDKNSQVFSLKVENGMDISRNVTVEYYTESAGRASEKRSQNISVAAFGEETLAVDAETGKYGFFTLNATIKSSTGAVLKELEPVRFSVVKAPPVGVHNPSLGTNLDIRWDSDAVMTTKMNLAERIGMGFFRIEIAMAQYNSDRAEGETGIDAKQQNVLKQMKEKGVSATVTLGYGDPEKEDYIDEITKYALALVDDPLVKDLTDDFSLLNEADHKTTYDVNRYIEIAKALDTALDGKAKLWGPVSAGMASTWVDNFFTLGGGKYIDGVDIHGYTLKSTPEGGTLVSAHQSTNEILKKTGNDSMPVYKSEYGWTSVGEDGYSNEHQQAYYNVRMLFLNDYYGLWDKAAAYRLDDTGPNNTQEERFGMIRYIHSDIPHEAKPLYLTYANYNALMTGAEFIERVELCDDVAVYRYRLQDGRDCAVTWSISGAAQQSIKLGTESVELYDSYGNQETIYSVGGDFMLGLTEEPIYLIGDFDSVAKGTNSITLSQNKLSLAPGYGSEVKLTKNFEGDAEVTLDLPDNLKQEENSGFTENSAWVVVHANSMGEENEDVIVYVKKDNKIIYRTKLAAEYNDSGIAVTLDGKPLTGASKLEAEDTVLVSVAPNVISEAAQIIAAGYKAGALSELKAVSVSAEKLSQEGTQLELQVADGIDLLCVYIWNKNLTPITEVFKIGG